MLVVHKDYVQAFIQIRDDLREGKMNASDVRNFLDRRRHDYLHERSAALALAQELAASERRPIRGDAWSAILAYCEAIENYLLTPYQLNWTSRYRRLLDMTADVDFNSNLMIFPTADASEQSRQVLDFSNVINDLLDKEMPCAIDELNFTYAKLRTLLLQSRTLRVKLDISRAMGPRRRARRVVGGRS